MSMINWIKLQIIVKVAVNGYTRNSAAGNCRVKLIATSFC